MRKIEKPFSFASRLIYNGKDHGEILITGVGYYKPYNHDVDEDLSSLFDYDVDSVFLDGQDSTNAYKFACVSTGTIESKVDDLTYAHMPYLFKLELAQYTGKQHTNIEPLQGEFPTSEKLQDAIQTIRSYSRGIVHTISYAA